MGSISVVVPAYNQGRFLAKSLGSILRQTRKADEVIVIDNGSSDKTGNILKDFKKSLKGKDIDRFKFVWLEKNIGPCGAFNKGLAMSSCDYLIILSADDWFAEDILEEEATVLDKNPNIAVVYSQAFSINEETGEQVVAKPAGETTVLGRNEFERLLTRGDFIPFLTGMFRRSLYKELGGYDVNLRFRIDWEYWIRLAKEGPFAYLAKPLAYYRVHGENDHLNPSFLKSYASEFSYILEKHLPKGDKTFEGIRKQAYCDFYRTLFNQKVAEGKFREAFDYLLKSIKEKTFSLSHLTIWRQLVIYFKNKITDAI